MTTDEQQPARLARALMRTCDRATLATALAADAWPYGSLVLGAAEHSGNPILLLSSLALHSRNLAEDNRVSLLFDGTAGLDDPLTGARLTVLGRAERSDDPSLRARYLARHPSAAQYADFGDFAFYRVAVERAHLVAGFGRIDWIEARALLFDTAGYAALGAAEPGIVAHMNADHADAIALYAEALLGLDGDGWVMTGCDPEGCDLRAAGRVARLEFGAPVGDGAGARAELIRLVGEARRHGAAG